MSGRVERRAGQTGRLYRLDPGPGPGFAAARGWPVWL